MAAFASFLKQSRMKFANATNLDRKSLEAAQANLETKEGWRARRKWMLPIPPGYRVKRLGVAAENLGRQSGQATGLGGLAAAAREVGDDQRKHHSND
jgi:hypothetical protein